ncbi:glutamate/gamma-aminobutyrate family transporter YjeM [Fructilactobacillus lindneri]|uniref:Inner membrane transporter yjeM n=2 Tax=Fructilactobacillus lindneri TaxID=53444 RepID=A0A0R2JXI2_9LACO|nr:glutamate/gamma-aminobutyrate family transporter YjeM [Fructilactobacillus lindneri]ANZ57762.1 glutamate/gamma-aminobutyrate family transporter YjeM [Fructilactobacillus lindneri]ANZ59031.1 glutamate/gamma-aminobutyrate family transporter YjeM [Fructilactobacillus lindneri]KRN78797.1 inner membrane transporter yjeM [Fructilactobacillus lindneri DSM 20690 = JCM 11027]POG98085.1 glutamate/gamma-aminobutyrate family transporter YjeM [Fructilactobacillus lindneri]POH01800.1 glutamate/gamma-amin
MKKRQLTPLSLVLMVFTSIFNFVNIPRAFYLMGYAAIPWYILAAVCFFLPFAFMVAEFGSAYPDAQGGIYTWMAESVNPRFAFIGIIMWYSSFITWMLNTSSIIWIPISTAIFGVDKTQSWHLFGLSDVQTLGILAAILVIVITFVASRGLGRFKLITSIGGSAMLLASFILIVGGSIILLLNGHPLQPLSFLSLIKSPNPQYATGISVLSFSVYAIFAFGGIEIISGLVDQTKNPKKTFPRGVAISAILITLVYALGIFVTGMFTNWDKVFNVADGSKVNLGNEAFIAMNNFGYQLGLALHFSHGVATQMGLWTGRYIGISMFLALIGAFTTVVFSPVKQLVEGTPKEIWPKYLRKIKNDLPVNAMKVQVLLVILFILLVAFGGQNAKIFFQVVISMTNVAMSLPYLFIAYAFWQFRKKGKIKQSFTFYKGYSSARLAAIVVLLTVGLANVFTLISPVLQGQWMTTVWMIVGPIVFAVIGLVLYRRYEKKI